MSLTGFLLAACGPVLPSSEPLGIGKGAEPEPEPAVGRYRRRALASRGRGDETKKPEADTASGDLSSTTADEGLDAGPGTTTAIDAGKETAETAPDSGGPLPDLAGRYTGNDVTITKLPERDEQRDEDPKAITDVEVTSANRVVIVILDSSTEKPYCRVGAALRGERATIDPRQSCFDTPGVVTGQVDAGEAVFSKERLVLDLRGTLEFLNEEDLRGEFEYHFEGSR